MYRQEWAYNPRPELNRVAEHLEVGIRLLTVKRSQNRPTAVGKLDPGRENACSRSESLLPDELPHGCVLGIVDLVNVADSDCGTNRFAVGLFAEQ